MHHAATTYLVFPRLSKPEVRLYTHFQSATAEPLSNCAPTVLPVTSQAFDCLIADSAVLPPAAQSIPSTIAAGAITAAHRLR